MLRLKLLFQEKNSQLTKLPTQGVLKGPLLLPNVPRTKGDPLDSRPPRPLPAPTENNKILGQKIPNLKKKFPSQPVLQLELF
jgi:hypothetical protein